MPKQFHNFIYNLKIDDHLLSTSNGLEQSIEIGQVSSSLSCKTHKFKNQQKRSLQVKYDKKS
jgi:hypothetical protein